MSTRRNAYSDAYSDDYEAYENLFDPMKTDRQARRKRKPKVSHTPKKDRGEVIEEIADTTGLETGFNTTYTPGLFEEAWLHSSLRTFFEQSLITDLLARVQGGKEANVYRCEAHPSLGMPYLAVKVYRPRMFRNLRNDKVYREGREVLTANGRAVKGNDHRTMRAIGKKTAYGEQVAHTSWLMYEYTTLDRLHRAGAAVPQPIASAENAILMGYVGDGHIAAPTLHEIRLDPDEVRPLFIEVMRNIRLMLAYDIVHGDLSAYNILYWDGDIVFIDFPQVVNPHANDFARTILERDIRRICQYFAGHGLEADPEAITNALWQEYVALSPEDEAADLSRLIPEPDDIGDDEGL